MSEDERVAPKENVGVLTAALVFVDCDTIGVVLKFELKVDADVAGAKRNINAQAKTFLKDNSIPVTVRHFSGCCLAYSS